MEEFADIRRAFDMWSNRFPNASRLEWEFKDVQDAFERLALRSDEIES